MRILRLALIVFALLAPVRLLATPVCCAKPAKRHAACCTKSTAAQPVAPACTCDLQAHDMPETVPAPTATPAAPELACSPPSSPRDVAVFGATSATGAPWRAPPRRTPLEASSRLRI